MNWVYLIHLNHHVSAEVSLLSIIYERKVYALVSINNKMVVYWNNIIWVKRFDWSFHYLRIRCVDES